MTDLEKVRAGAAALARAHSNAFIITSEDGTVMRNFGLHIARSIEQMPIEQLMKFRNERS